VNKKISFCTLVLLLIFVTGCSASKAASVYEYRTTGNDIEPSLYLVKTEYYSDEVVIYWDGTVSSLENWRFSDDFIVDGKKLILKTEDPSAFNSFSVRLEDFSYSFRYLDSEQYACLYTIMDSEGGLHYSGSIDRYYTDEEIARQNEHAHKQEEKQKDIFGKLEGLWVCEDGDYIRVYEDESYVLEFSVNGEQGKESQVYFQDNLYAKKNNMGIFYNDGLFEVGFDVVLAEDGSSFEYRDKIFVRENTKNNNSELTEVIKNSKLSCGTIASNEEDTRIDYFIMDDKIYVTGKYSGKSFEIDLTDDKMEQFINEIIEYAPTVQEREYDYWPHSDEYPEMYVLFEYELLFENGYKYKMDGANCYPADWNQFVNKIVELIERA